MIGLIIFEAVVALVAALGLGSAFLQWRSRGKEPTNSALGPQWKIGWAVSSTLAIGVLLGLNLTLYFAWLSTSGHHFISSAWFNQVKNGGWFEAARAAVTALAALGVGAVAYLAYRRQHSKEAERADALNRDRQTVERDLHERFTEAAKQLSDENVSVRLAGVYALAALADDWLKLAHTGQAQAVVNVLMAYLRTDTLPAAIHPADKAFAAEKQVRNSVVGEIRDRRDTRHTGTGWHVLKLDLTGANLSGATLARTNLTGANLTNANLTHTDLSQATLTLANLFDANLEGASLAGATLVGATMFGANLTEADLTRANLTEANLTEANLTRANLTRGVLNRANLTRAQLRRADLSEGRLAGANLLDAHLSRACLSGTDLTQANFNHVNDARREQFAPEQLASMKELPPFEEDEHEAL